MLNKLINLARSQIGTAERPLGSNDIIYNHEYWGEKSSYADLPWCVVFCWWCCRKTGVDFPDTAHCNGVESYAKEHGAWTAGAYKPGDFVIFDYDRDGSRDHIGLVIEVDGNVLITVEGNYGDKVAKVSRSVSEVIGAYRPDYGDGDANQSPPQSAEPTLHCGAAAAGSYSPPGCNSTPAETAEAVPPQGAAVLPVLSLGSKGPAVGALQVLLRLHGHQLMNSFYISTRRPDCEFGPETERALIAQCGTAVTSASVWRTLIGEAEA